MTELGAETKNALAVFGELLRKHCPPHLTELALDSLIHFESVAVNATRATDALDGIRSMPWINMSGTLLADHLDLQQATTESALKLELAQARVRISNQDAQLANKRANLDAARADLAACRASNARLLEEVELLRARNVELHQRVHETAIKRVT